MKVEFVALNANASHQLCGASIGVPNYFLFGNFDPSTSSLGGQEMKQAEIKEWLIFNIARDKLLRFYL